MYKDGRFILNKLFSPITKSKSLGICAPSARFNSDQFSNALSLVESMGFTPQVPEEIFEKKRYLAGTDKQRAAVINSLFVNSEVDAILCARGGFGAMRMLNYLDWDLINNNHKPFIGFSDNTAILLSLIERTDCPVIHGPTLTSLVKAELQTIQSLIDILKEPKTLLKYKIDKNLNVGSNKTNICGRFVGGNLSTISHLIGTEFMPDFKSSILFLEEINEPAYKIDRMLTQMKLAGCFDQLCAVVTGSFEDCAQPQYINEIFADIFQPYGVPVFTGLSCGHGDVNLSIPLGIECRIDLDKFELVFHE